MALYVKKVPRWTAVQYDNETDTSGLEALGCTLAIVNEQLCLFDGEFNYPIPLNGWVTKSSTGQFEIWTEEQFGEIFEEF